ncbi:MazG family protein [Proteiniclasticum sp. QWL-01]|uniref:MazG family protein n=1 Tax=Proteiniclasticum sp. QWL-01 TaxID=3036945 RepID=UPI00240F9BBB|nr:MazG family protein [Proteiniclasticum sp. QWL-01]WFF72531.1 MazG family protein [Proteiniclasticum sp. QWL-01]
MIHIAGLGPGDPGSLTMETFELLKRTRVLLRTRIHPTVAALDSWGIRYASLDHLYEKNASFQEVYRSLAEEVIAAWRREGTELTYCVPGNPMIAEQSVVELISRLEQEGIPYVVHPAVSFIDTILDVLRRDPIRGLLILDATELRDKGLSGDTDTVVTQVYNRRIASEVKLALSDYLDDEAEIIYVRNAGIKGEETVRRIPLWALDRQEDVDHLTTVFIERESVKPGFQDFRRTINALREPGGCPWDREQTHESLRRYLIEEAYEAADAITQGNLEDMKEELGDVLLQVVLHGRIAEEQGDFTILDIIRSVNDKMISRHPHVFGTLDLKNSQEVLSNWEKIKKTEKGEVSLDDKLKSLPKSIPATMRAAEVAKKAEAYGRPRRSRDELLAQIRRILNENLEEEQDLAELLYYTVLLLDGAGFQPEALLTHRVEQEIKHLTKSDEI